MKYGAVEMGAGDMGAGAVDANSDLGKFACLPCGMSFR